MSRERSMKIPLRMLLIEDAEDDALSLARQLGQSGYDLLFKRVETAEAMRAALVAEEWDLVISDYSLPGFSALGALEVLKKSGIDLPFIILSGDIGEETAVEAMRAGAHDYVMKNNLARLMPAIERELREAESRRKRRRAEEELRDSEKRFRSIFQNAVAGIALLAVDGRFLQVNPAFCRMLKYSEEELLKLNTFEITHPDDQTLARRLFSEAEKGKRKSVDYQKRFICRDGEILWAHIAMAWLHDDGDQPTYAVGLVTDITPHHQARQEMRQMAYFDSLTGLPNRQLFLERCSQVLARARRENRQVAVFIVDLDRFKGINDTFGYAAGDHTLKTVSEKLSRCVSREDILARLVSDEFALVVSEFESQEEYSIIAEKIQKALADPVDLEQQPVCCSASIGIALYPLDGADVDVLLKNAGTALHKAQEHGLSSWRFFSKDMNLMARERLVMEAGLRRALERRELSLHYQPQIDLASGEVIAMEALLRWESPELGSVPPNRFIPLTEQTGLIIEIGAWVLEAACRQARLWHEAGFSSLRMAVNISPSQFKQADFIDRLDRALLVSGIDPTLLELEVTESVVMERSDEALMTLTDLKSRGIKLAIDDFGTGYSMLSYLKNFPVDRLKIDRSFVSDISTDSDDAAITEAIIAMAHGLKIKVLAEGVETREQLDFLTARRCEEGQGYYFARPLPAEQADEFLCNRFDATRKSPFR
jgi:diguanylate cyclase (GGDEF)-like protein/PAS domain S-box-containing protein